MNHIYETWAINSFVYETWAINRQAEMYLMTMEMIEEYVKNTMNVQKHE